MSETKSTGTAHCLRCGRTLSAAASIARGYGPTCRTRVRRAAANVVDFSAAQLDSAAELIEDGAIVPIRPGVFRTVATDGTGTYLTAPQGCTCPAGLKARRCYHRAAAQILLAA
jgi:uncharacterized protein DUF6011